ncbi:MAG: hypothetical protein KAT04_12635 [Methylococcales bacterium]|nr:hypothetical protein [Methylococcales bacterium]
MKKAFVSLWVALRILEGRQGQMILLDDRQCYEKLINETVLAGARKYKACNIIGLSIRTLQCWQAEGRNSGK